MTKIYAFCLWAAAAGMTTPVLAQAAPTPAGPASFDVAGVRLGATPEQAKEGLVRAGYKIDSVSPAQSFGQAVAGEAARRQGKPTPWPKQAGTFSIAATGPHQEHAEVKFEQTPAGSVVNNVTVQIPETAMTTEAFREQVTAKYGKPNAVRSLGTDLYWCSPEVARVCGAPLVQEGPRDNFFPLLIATTGNGGGRLWLQAGLDAERQAARDREAAVLRLAPKTDEAAF